MEAFGDDIKAATGGFAGLFTARLGFSAREYQSGNNTKGWMALHGLNVIRSGVPGGGHTRNDWSSP